MSTATQENRTNILKIEELEALTLKQWLEEDKAVLLDVREPGEHANERISGAKLLPLSNFDPGAFPK